LMGSGGAERRLLEREKRYDRERRERVKRSEEYDVLEEVFDKPTLMLIYRLINRGVLSELGGVVSAGKESRVYHGLAAGREVAVKIYLTANAEFRRGMARYILGDQRFKGVKRDVRSLIQAWARKEYVNLQEMARVGIPVPQPIHVERNILVMGFIGLGGERAPLLKEAIVEDPGALYKELMGIVETMVVKAGLVHGDLSEFNVMMWEGRPVIFDVSQSVPVSHPLAKSLLERDVSNINKYFRDQGVETLDLHGFVGRLIGDGGE